MAKGANPTVGTMAHPGQVDVRIAAKGSDEAAARALIAPVEALVRSRLGDTVFGTDGESLEGVVGARLAARGQRLGLVEVGTGGLVSERLTSVAGLAGRLESLVATLEAAQGRLGVSSSSAAELARAVRTWAGTDVGSAVVMAAAEGEGPNPVHPTRIGVATAEGASEVEHRPGGDLRQARIRATILALDGLRRALAGSA
jgi:nicotinamide-nucleotide amidase